MIGSSVFRRPTTLAAIAIVAVVVVTVGPAAAQVGGFGQQTDDEIDPDTIVLQVQVDGDGTAEWRIEHRYELTDENRAAAFADLADDIAANETTYLDRFTERLTATIAAAADATGREMRLENASISADTRQLPQEYGVVTYRFEWTNFAAVDGDRLLVGDALGGLFLDEQTRLLISFPDGYVLEDSVTPEPDDRQETAVTWIGPVEFGPDGPTAVASSTDGSGLSLSLVVAGAAAVAVAIAILAGAVYRRHDPSDTAQADESGAEPDRDRDTTDTPDETPPDELLSNEEQVLKLLEEHGGRIKQQAVVEELGWTDAKTSQVVSQLREDDRVESFRLGRENVLRLPEDDEIDL